MLAKLGVAWSSLVRIAGYVAIPSAVASWYAAFARVPNATFGRDIIPMWQLANHHHQTAAHHEGAE